MTIGPKRRTDSSDADETITSAQIGEQPAVTVTANRNRLMVDPHYLHLARVSYLEQIPGGLKSNRASSPKKKAPLGSF